MQPQTKNKEKTFSLHQLKHLSCKQFHEIVKGDSTFFRKFKKSAKYSWAKEDK